MVVQIIFFATMYPVLFILYFVMRGIGEAKNGYSFGLRMKAEWIKDEEAQKIVQQYRKELKKLMIVMALIPLVTFFISYMSVSFTIWMIWLLAAIAVPMIPYVRGHHRMRDLKQVRGWKKQSGERNLTEIKNVGKVRRVTLLPFLPPMVISVAVAVWSMIQFQDSALGGLAWCVVIFALTTVLFYGVAVWMDRQKIEVISDDSDVNLNYARAKKNIWKNLWLMVAWVSTAFTVFIVIDLYVDTWATGGILIGSIVYTIVTLALMLWAWKKVLSVDARYQVKRDAASENEEDDDDHWLWGMFYYNKNDKHTIVNQRVGFGTTMNLATPAGMGLTIFGYAVLILVVPISCIWLILEEFTPTQLAVEENILVAEHLKIEYEIPVADMESVTLIDELPNWSKVNGTGMDHLCKGTFHIRNTGDCEVFLDPQNAVFLQIETADNIYYMSAPEDVDTEVIYQELLEAMEVQ